MGDDLGTPFDKSKSHTSALKTNKYGASKMKLLKACTSREILLMKRNTFVYIFKSAQLSVMALIMMTLVLRTEMHRESVNDGSIYMGALFFTVSTAMFNGLAEVSVTTAKLPVFNKQRNLLLFPPGCMRNLHGSSKSLFYLLKLSSGCFLLINAGSVLQQWVAV